LHHSSYRLQRSPTKMLLKRCMTVQIDHRPVSGSLYHRKFVSFCPYTLLPTLTHEHLSIPPHDETMKITVSTGFALQLDRQLVYTSLCQCPTFQLKDTSRAQGLLGFALNRSEVHNGMVIFAGIIVRNQLVRQFFEQVLALGRIDRHVDTKHPGQYPKYIAVQYGSSFV